MSSKRESEPKDFLWVNKGSASTSLSSSDRLESQRIFQFVQRQRSDSSAGNKNAKRSRRSVKRDQKPPDLPHLAPEGTASSQQVNLRVTSDVRASRSMTTDLVEDPRQGHNDRNISRNPATPPPPTPPSEWIVRFRQSRQSIPSQNYTPGSAVDPFSATPISMSRNVEILVKYHIIFSGTGSHNDKTEVLPAHLQPVERYTKVREVLFRYCMQDKVDLAGMLAVMAARMVHMSRIPVIGNAGPEAYMQMALGALREQMHECQTKDIPRNVLVRGMHSLALAACICQQFEAAATHIRAAKSLFHLLDTNDPLDAFVAEGLFNIDRMISVETGWLPEFQLMYDPGPLDPSRSSFIKQEIRDYTSGRRQPSLTPRSPVPGARSITDALVSHQVDFLADAALTLDFQLGHGFESALNAEVFHPLLASIIRDTLDCLTVGKYVWRTSDATRHDADWMCKRMRAICHRLLLLPASLSFHGSTVHTMKTESLRIALLLVIVRCTNRMSYRTAQPNMRRLQRALSGIDTNWAGTTPMSGVQACPVEATSSAPKPRSPLSNLSATLPYNENALLLWVLMTGHFAAQGAPEEQWFLMRAAFVAETHLGLRDYDDLKNFMTGYFYSSTQQQQSLMIVSLHLAG